MPPKVKFQKEEIVRAALKVVREQGIDAVTAREVAKELGVSPRPIFTYYDTMEQLRSDVYEMAKEEYRAYIERGLAGPVPFRGVGQQYLMFAREEPELYKVLFLTKPGGASGGAEEALAFSQDLVRESLMSFYQIDAQTADSYFRNLWLIAYSFATLIVTNESFYTAEQMGKIMGEISLSVCKAYKEIPGLAEGSADVDAEFRKLIGKQ